MIDRSPLDDPTPEDRLTRAKWARGVGIVYGTILLLLLAIVAAQRIHVEHNGPTAIANSPAARPVRTDQSPAGAIGSPTARQAASPISNPTRN